MSSYLKKPFTKIGMIEWLKVKALSSSPSTARKKKETYRTQAPIRISIRNSQIFVLVV
jgi:ribosomal protein S21